MPEDDCSISQNLIEEKLTNLNNYYLQRGLSHEDLFNVAFPETASKPKKSLKTHIIIYTAIATLLISILYNCNAFSFVYGIRCIIPNNYFIWEATRPISDCSFCSTLTEAIELSNVTREEFEPYAYSSKPIIVRGAFLHWPAMKKFSWKFFKELYASVEGSYKSVDQECQFLHFKSDFISIRDVFAMSEARVQNLANEKSWYVGWGNCHPVILQEMRKFYPKPHFLPADAEFPHKDYIFMGFDDGATMHLDYINRLMWQAQLQGSKIWKLVPPPECQKICKPVEFQIGPGDAVLLDTRVWYHATAIPNNQFSLSVQSEYG
ncbi:unnamed protein product [Ceutorhynchus assimilis]|uniref:Cupin-like domain-containing protein n=1 Tax=Ceutorhynchus assimilis TaxID=467358 RepID=A0A9N9QQY9_9CUCU|nr:unnamed protein product [Ceutorhynchus assimilis]